MSEAERNGSAPGAATTTAPAPTHGRHHRTHRREGHPPQRTERRRHHPPPNHSRRRETQAADPRKAARRRAPPLAAGTPENPIARAGGRVSRGAGSHRISAHRRGEPPAPPLVDLRQPQMPRTALYLVSRFLDTHHIWTQQKKGAEPKPRPPFLILPTDTKSHPVRRSSPKRIPRRQARGRLSWLESAARCSGIRHGTGTHPEAV